MTTRVATIAIHGLKTPSQWVARLLVECANDSGMSDVVATAGSSVWWDGTNNNQKDYMSFPGLTYGQTYYLRCGTVCPITNDITWSAVQGIQAGTGVVISLAYSTSLTVTSSGVHYSITPNSPPSNTDHYEAYWNFSGTAPDASAKPNWIGETGQRPDFFVPAGIGQLVSVWLRAISTDHIPQGWVSLPGEGVRPVASQNGEVDVWGSLPPTCVSQITYTSSASEITWYWNGTAGSSQITLYLANNTTHLIPGSQVGVGSLTASTTYYFYPYYFVSGDYIVFVQGGTAGVNDGAINGNGAGNNAAYTTKSLAAAQFQAQWGNMPIANGALAAATTASGTSGGQGGGSGGGGGGGGGCPKRGMVVMTKTRGIQKIENVMVGEWIKTRVCEITPDGWTEVLRNDPVKEFEFIRIVTRVGGEEQEIEQSLMTPMPLARGQKMSTELGLGDLLIVDDADQQYGMIRKLEVTEAEPGTEEAEKRVITCSPSPEFFCGKTKPVILTHNVMMQK